MNATQMTAAAANLTDWASVCALNNAILDFEDAYYRILRDGKPRPADMVAAVKIARAAIKAWLANWS